MSPAESLFKSEMQPICKWKYKNRPTDAYDICRAGDLICEMENCTPFKFSTIIVKHLITITAKNQEIHETKSK